MHTPAGIGPLNFNRRASNSSNLNIIPSFLHLPGLGAKISYMGKKFYFSTLNWSCHINLPYVQLKVLIILVLILLKISFTSSDSSELPLTDILAISLPIGSSPNRSSWYS